jgi:hypothetical protein
MAAKQKITRQRQSSNDKGMNMKFILIVAALTLLLMFLVYWAFVR